MHAYIRDLITNQNPQSCVPKKMTWNFASMAEALRDSKTYGFATPDNGKATLSQNQIRGDVLTRFAKFRTTSQFSRRSEMNQYIKRSFLTRRIGPRKASHLWYVVPRPTSTFSFLQSNTQTDNSCFLARHSFFLWIT